MLTVDTVLIVVKGIFTQPQLVKNWTWRPLLPHLAIISSALERDSFGFLTEVTQNLLASARDIRSFSRRNSQELGWTETGIGLIGLIGLNMTEYCWKILLQPSGSGLDCDFSSRPTFGASWRICSTGASKDRKLVSCGFGTVCFGASMCCSRNCCSWFACDRWSAIANANKIRLGYMILWGYKSYYKSYDNSYYNSYLFCVSCVSDLHLCHVLLQEHGIPEMRPDVAIQGAQRRLKMSSSPSSPSPKRIRTAVAVTWCISFSKIWMVAQIAFK